MAHLDEILQVNKKSTPLSGAAPLSVEARRELCIITCVDPRLTRFFSTVLGIERGDAVLIRLPGASVLTGHGDALRAVAAAVYINQAKEVLLLGHTDCGTTRVDDSSVAALMRDRGLDPNTMPGGPRKFLGCTPDLRGALQASAAAIRGAPFLPRDLLVHAAILDIQSGVLEIVERGENFAQNPSAPAEPPSPGQSILDGLSTSLTNVLGDGMSVLNSSSYSGLSALSTRTDSIASGSTSALTSAPLPPGWDTASSILASQPGALEAATRTLESNVPPQVEVDLSSITSSAPPRQAPVPVAKFESKPAPPPLSSRAPPRKPNNKQQSSKPKQLPSKSSGSRSTQAQKALDDSMSKVRDFYRMEFTLDQRRAISRSLASALNEGKGADELVKIAVRPILESGQKRYRVIDELIVMKEQAVQLPADAAYELLSQLVT
jgi:carbonic anhydrase